jgi:beta-glucosidase
MLSDTLMTNDSVIEVSVEVTNTSDRDGTEVIQWYIHDHFAMAARPIKELKYFEKAMIKAGETQTFRFQISPETLKYYDHLENFVVEAGSFSVMVGPNSVDLQSSNFHFVEE